MTQEGQEEHAPHSCTHCNKSHRRCDRKLPSCSTCAKKGRTCLYDQSIRSYNKNARYEPYPQYEKELILDPLPPPPTVMAAVTPQSPPQVVNVTQSIPMVTIIPPLPILQVPQVSTSDMPPVTTFSSIENILKVLNDGNANTIEAELDRYFDNMFISTPFLEGQRASVAVLNRKMLAQGGKFPTDVSEREDLAACFGMQALFYKRIQQHEQAKVTRQAIVALLDGLFDRVLTSFSLATAYMFLTFCLVDECEFDRASFYNMCVEAFLNRCKKVNKPQDELYIIRERYLRCMYLLVHHHRTDCTDLSRLLKIMISCHFLNKKYYRRSHRMQSAPSLTMGTVQDEDVDKFLPFVDVILDDLDNGRNGFPITPAVVDLMTNKMKDLLNESKEHNQMDLYFKRIGFYVIAQGAKLQCLLNDGSRNMDLEARQVAEHIADICSAREFVYCWATVQHAVSIAIRTLTIFLHSTVIPADQDHLVGKLRMLVLSLRVLAQKYKIVAYRHSALIENTERIIKAHEDHTKLLSLYASLSTTPDLTWNPVSFVTAEQPHVVHPPQAQEQVVTEKPQAENLSNGVRLNFEDVDLELFFGDFLADKCTHDRVLNNNSNTTPQQDLFL